MKLNLNDIKKITFGATAITEENGVIEFKRFTEKQKECYLTLRTRSLHHKVNATSGVRFSFITNSSFLNLKYVMVYASSRNYAYFDLLVDGQLYHHFGVINVTEEEERFEKITLPIGEKHIELYFPWSVGAKLSLVEVEDGAKITPVKRKNVMLSFGDSITQGYDGKYPTNTYNSKLSKFLDADVYNKAIGGDTFFPELLLNGDGIVPDIVTVAYGTNDWFRLKEEDFKFNAKAFFELLIEKYSYSKIIVITPLWRKEEEGVAPNGYSLDSVREFIKNTALSYSGVTVIDGKDLVPHDLEMYEDKRLHPSDRGFNEYSENLIKKLKNLV